MSDFIQLHLLTNYAPSNLNRDDLGRPKTARMGAIDRFRISSQCAKNAWRNSENFSKSVVGELGIRTKKFGLKVYDHMIKKGASEKNALKWATEIASQFGKSKKTKNAMDSLMIEQIAHISPEEKKGALKLAEKLVKDKRDPTKEELNLLMKNSRAIDIALFGRMLASSPKNNTEAAVQVAHALSVNQMTVEDDYFTAVDELNANNSGSAHIGESSFGSGVFYTYICINKSLLIENLKDKKLAIKAIKALTESAAIVSPSGKQNSFASRARALYVLAEKGSQQPRQLSSAFLRPVENIDMVNEAIKRIETLRENMDKVYGACADETCTMNVEKGKGTLAKILKFVGA